MTKRRELYKVYDENGATNSIYDAESIEHAAARAKADYGPAATVAYIEEPYPSDLARALRI